MIQSKVFNSELEMKEYIVELWDSLFTIDDIVLSDETFDESRIGWKDTKYVCIKSLGDKDYIKLYNTPQCIGMCSNDYDRDDIAKIEWDNYVHDYQKEDFYDIAGGKGKYFKEPNKNRRHLKLGDVVYIKWSWGSTKSQRMAGNYFVVIFNGNVYTLTGKNDTEPFHPKYISAVTYAMAYNIWGLEIFLNKYSTIYGFSKDIEYWFIKEEL